MCAISSTDHFHTTSCLLFITSQTILHGVFHFYSLFNSFLKRLAINYFLNACLIQLLHLSLTTICNITQESSLLSSGGKGFASLYQGTYHCLQKDPEGVQNGLFELSLRSSKGHLLLIKVEPESLLLCHQLTETNPERAHEEVPLHMSSK